MFKFVVLCAVVAVARAGYLGAPAVASYGYAAPAIHAAPVAYGAVAAPAVVSQQSNILRGFGNLGSVSTYAKTLDTPFSSVTKSDIRVTNPGLRAVAPVAAISPAIAAPAIGTTYHGHAFGLAAPAAVGYGAAPLAYGHGYGAGYAGLGYAGRVGYAGHLGYGASHVGYGAGLGYAGRIGYGAGHVGYGAGLGYAGRLGYGAGHVGYGAGLGYAGAGHLGYGAGVGYGARAGYGYGAGLGYSAGYGVHPAAAHVSYTSNYGSYAW